MYIHWSPLVSRLQLWPSFNLSVFILRTYVLQRAILQIFQVLHRLLPETEESLGSIALKWALPRE